MVVWYQKQKMGLGRVEYTDPFDSEESSENATLYPVSDCAVSTSLLYLKVPFKSVPSWPARAWSCIHVLSIPDRISTRE